MLRFTIGCAAACLVLSGPAHAQRADDNAVTAAEDAFGSSVGRESIGIYSGSQVRGFSPSTAQNLRIEGLYFDNQAFISQRLVQSSTVRVSFSALGYPFPAPTGIVDYTLRKAGDRRIVSVVGGIGDYAAPFAEIDVQLPLTDTLGLAGGISAAHEEYYDGADAIYLRGALSLRWRPTEGIDVIPFTSVTQGLDEETAPTLITTGSFAPPEVRRRRYFGADWSTRTIVNGISGVIVKARIDDDLALSAGAFHAFYGQNRGFADIFSINADETAQESVRPDPSQYREAFSGEVRATRSFQDGDRLHLLHLSVRARDRTNRYAGTGRTIVAPVRRLGTPSQLPEPTDFSFREQSRDRLDQIAAGLSYEGRWRDRGELILGVQRTRFEKRVALPTQPDSAIRDTLWLYNAAAAVNLTARLSLYAGYTRGLEESGVAPDNAANRLEVLPPIRTTQRDVSLRYNLPGDIRLTAGLFDVRKPYFSNDPQNVFRELGEVRHRGAEMSLAGSPVAGTSIILGAVLMAPRVTGSEVERGIIGDRPVGQAGTILRGNVDQALGFAPGWSLNGGISHNGNRVASRSNDLVLPAFTLIDIGARYRFELGGSPAQFRIALSNVTNTYYFNVAGANAFSLTDGRRLAAYLSVDL